MIRRPPRSTLFPYTTLFRSTLRRRDAEASRPQRISPCGIASLTCQDGRIGGYPPLGDRERKSLKPHHAKNSYAVFCFEKKKKQDQNDTTRILGYRKTTRSHA